jgi:molybdopterin converting factor small subunit
MIFDHLSSSKIQGRNSGKNEYTQAMPIRVKVYAPAFIRRKDVDEDGCITLKDGATLNDLCRELQIPIIYRASLFYAVNYEHAKMNTTLQDADIVTFLFPIVGG